MAGITNRGTRVHPSKKQYNRKNLDLDIDLDFEDELDSDEIYFQSSGVVDYGHTYSLPVKVSRQLGLC